MPNGFVRGAAFGGVSREYFEASGDPSVAWDSKGNAYYNCMMFDRGVPTTNNPDLSSAIYMFRSTANSGASWNFPGRPVVEDYDTTGATLIDKPYMAIDNRAGSPFQDRIYVSWTFFNSDGTAYLFEAYSSDYGETFSSPVLVSTDNPTLCTNTYGLPTPNGNCNENQFSDPFVGPDGALYVAFDNYNNTVTGSDNRNQVLLVKSTDGGASFSAPVKVADFYDLPDCLTYQGADAFRACVPEKGSQTDSIFRATNYPSGGVDPTNANHVAVTVGSYINKDSKESNGCVPAGLSGTTGLNLYTGVKTAGACNNKILVSVSTDGGSTFTGTTIDPRDLTVVNQQANQTTTDQWWQWSAFNTNGKLVVAYYDRQYGDDETSGSMDISISASTSLTNFATKRVTTSSMPLPTQFPDANGNSLFFGDYTGLSVSGTANPIWMDTRNPDLALCPGTGTPGVPPALCTFLEPNGRQANFSPRPSSACRNDRSGPGPTKGAAAAAPLLSGEACRELGQRAHRRPVPGRRGDGELLLDKGVAQLRSAVAVRAVEEDVLLGDAKLVRGEGAAVQPAGTLGVRRRGQEGHVQLRRIGVRQEGVAVHNRSELCRRSHEHLDLEAEAASDAFLQRLPELRGRERASADDVAALDVRAHVLGAKLLDHLAQIRHRDPVA